MKGLKALSPATCWPTLNPAKAPATPPKTPPKAPPTAKICPALHTPEPEADPVGKCTKTEAWDEICKKTEAERVDGTVTDKALNDAWLAAIQKQVSAGPSDDPAYITPEGWYQVKVEVLDALDVIPF